MFKQLPNFNIYLAFDMSITVRDWYRTNSFILSMVDNRYMNQMVISLNYHKYIPDILKKMSTYYHKYIPDIFKKISTYSRECLYQV